jgi:type I restriction enzyme S subunit
MERWQTRRLGELGSIFSGNSISENYKSAHFRGVSDGIPYIGTKDVGFDRQINYDSGVQIPLEKADGFKLAPPNTTLVCAEGGSAGRKIGFTDREIFFGNKLYAICPSEDTCSKFIFYHCLTDQFAASFKDAKSGIIGGVSLNKFKSFPIAVPRLAEQQRIVTILDEVFAGLVTATTNAEKNRKNANELFDSYLNSVFEHECEEWRTRSLQNLCENDRVITYGVIKLGKHTPEGDPCLRTSNVRRLRIDTDGIKKILPALSNEFSRTVLRGGEVLVAVRGSLGGVAVAAHTMRGWNVSREVAVVPVDSAHIEPEYLAYFIATKRSQNWLSAVQKGAAYVGVNISDLRTLPISFPSKEEQRRLIGSLQSLSAETRSLEAVYASQLSRMDDLKQSVLRAAFSGELTSPPTQAVKEAAE